jgi:ribosome-associated toxin RatA of RatAB toxin-antitoxin module
MESYAQHMASVQSVVILERDRKHVISKWVVLFNGGTMQWIERDDFDHDTCSIIFRQIEGDLEHFSGILKVCPVGENQSIIEININFDLGLPELSGLLNPHVEDNLRENFLEMLAAVAFQAIVGPIAHLRTGAGS